MLWGQFTCVFHKATVVSRLVSTWTRTLQLLCTLPLGCEHLCVRVFVGEGFMSAETFWHVVTEEAQV